MKHYDELTPKQKLFVDAYILNRGNATQAYIDAGYKAKNRKTAASAAYRLKSDENILKAIAERATRSEADRSVLIKELTDTLISIARAEPSMRMWFGESGEITPKFSEQISAAKELANLLNAHTQVSLDKEMAEIERIKAQTELLKSRINSGEDEQDQLLADIDLFDPLDDEVSDE